MRKLISKFKEDLFLNHLQVDDGLFNMTDTNNKAWLNNITTIEYEDSIYYINYSDYPPCKFILKNTAKFKKKLNALTGSDD